MCTYWISHYLLIFPYSNKALKVLLEICQLKLEFWVCFYMQMLLHLTIQTLGGKKPDNFPIVPKVCSKQHLFPIIETIMIG